MFAMGFEGIKFEGDVVEDLVAVAIEFIDVARGGRVGLQEIGAGVVDSLGKERVDDVGVNGADVERRGSDEEDFVGMDDAGR